MNPMVDVREDGISDGPSSADRAAARVLASIANITDPVVIELCAWCLFAARDAHSCIDLDRLRPDDVSSLASEGGPIEPDGELAAALIGRLNGSPGVRVIGPDEVPEVDSSLADTRPLVLFERFLYSQRQFVDELSVAEQFDSRCRRTPVRGTEFASRLADMVKPRGDDEDANIENDVLRSLGSSRFMVLTGGAGTGKTTMTITAIAVSLMIAERPLEESDVALCAPTGKAARRLKEAIGQFLSDERSSWVDPRVKDVLRRVEPVTIHRLLGRGKGSSTRFRHNQEFRLRHAVVAVDEASMVSGQMMARLLEAIADDARLLLVGDPGQLESVEAGSVLGQLAREASGDSTRPDPHRASVFTLRKIWRSGSESAIPKLAAAIRDGNAEQTLERLSSGEGGIEWIQTDQPARVAESVAGDVAAVLRGVVDLARRTDDVEAHLEALRAAGGVKVLCGPREGARGVSSWNSWIAQRLGFSEGDLELPGRLVLVSQNSPRVQLANGDIGLIVDTSNGPKAAFTIVKPAEGNSASDSVATDVETVRYLSLAELPPVQTCFAMTIHKSQGSEYNEVVVVVLPGESSPLLNRQLLYTAVTRAKGKAKVRIVGTSAAVRKAVVSESGRASGLSMLVDRRARFGG